MVLFVAPASVGATFTSRTVTTRLLVTVAIPSLTRTRTVFVEGPCASDGVQASTPFVTTRPAGPETNAVVKGWAGTSLSLGASGCV